MIKKTPDWQENENDILAQFPDSLSSELLSLRQEPDWALKSLILSIPVDEQETNKRFQWPFSSRLFNQAVGAAVLALMIFLLGVWISSISSTDGPAITQPESAAPVTTLRPSATPTSDLQGTFERMWESLITATPTATGGCPVTRIFVDDPAGDSLGPGNYAINENRTIWANLDINGWQTDGVKVNWIKPVGSELVIEGRLLEGENSPPLGVTLPCCYSGDFQVTGLYFPIPGCWEITAEAGDEQIRFVTEVEWSDGFAVAGLSLLGYEINEEQLDSENLLNIDLFWQAGGADAVDLELFINQLDINGNLVDQSIQTIPADTWISQNITTSLSIPLNEGAHKLTVGLYNSETFTIFPFYFNNLLPFNGMVELPDTLDLYFE
jgi:hypothetical protein